MRKFGRILIGYMVFALALMAVVVMYLIYQPRPTEPAAIQNIEPNDTNSSETYITYLAPDDTGTLQLWRYDEGTTTQLTDVGTSITQYALQDNTLVYVSDGKLLLHMLDGSAPARELVSLQLPQYGGEYAYAFPTISPDGTTVIYANDGLYRVPITGGTSELLLEDVQLEGENAAPGDVRVYQESEFIDSDTLLLHVGIWEALLPAIYDLSAGQYQEAEPYTYPAAYALSDGRLLYYGNSFRGMLSGLYVAPTTNLLDVTPIIAGDYGGVVPTESAIVLGITEYQPGIVRLLLSWLPAEGETEPGSAIVDVDLSTNTASLVRRLTPDSDAQRIAQPQFSPDGSALIGIVDGDYRTDIYAGGAMVGQIGRYDIASDTLQILVSDEVMAVQQHAP